MAFILRVSLLLMLAMPQVCLAQEDPSGFEASDLESASSADTVTGIPREELVRSQALKSFLLKRYEAALDEFRIIASRYPQDIVLKRYAAVCLSELRRDDEALIAYRMILDEHPSDLPTLKLLAKLHLRRAETGLARVPLEKILTIDRPEGRFALYAKAQIERLDAIERDRVAASADQLSAADFMKSRAVVYFMDAKYEDAIREFETLELLHPKDVRIKRYKGISHDKLGDHEAAIRVFGEGLAVEPENAALRYALAQALFHKKDLDASAAELRKISEGAIISDYKIRADRDLEAIERIETIRASIEKKWNFALEQGLEFNSNAASEPTKREAIDEEHAVRFPGSFYANYTAYRQGAWTLSASYGYSHAFYSDTLDYLQTMAHSPTLSVSHMGSFAGRPLVTMFSSTYVHLSVAEQFYYQSYPQTLRMIYSFWDHHRMMLSERITWTDYKDQGSVPSSTSREGVANALGMSHTFYHNKERTLYTDWGYEFKAEDTDGSDYVRNVHQWSAGVTFPVWKDWSGAMSLRYKDADYPETTRAIERQDEEYLVDTRLTIPMSKNTNLKIYYDYLLNDSNDPFYKYTNHSGGASVATYF